MISALQASPRDETAVLVKLSSKRVELCCVVLGLAERKELAGDAAAHGECVASLDQLLDEEMTSQQLQQVQSLYTSLRYSDLLRALNPTALEGPAQNSSALCTPSCGDQLR